MSSARANASFHLFFAFLYFLKSEFPTLDPYYYMCHPHDQKFNVLHLSRVLLGEPKGKPAKGKQ